MDNVVLPPKTVETTVLARCGYCKKDLYVETITEKNQNNTLIETGRTIQGDASKLVCPCRDGGN